MDHLQTRREFLASSAIGGTILALGGCSTLGNARDNAKSMSGAVADVIVGNGKIATQDARRSFASAVAIREGRFLAVGDERTVMPHRGPHTRVIDVRGRTVIPGLNDSHIHVIRGGLNYNMELRWDGVTSLADAMSMLKEQALRTPPPQWVRVVGGWSEFQFQERRMPTLDEINAVSSDVPIFILHLYDRALLNRAALNAVGYTKDTPTPPGGEIQRDKNGNPTGMLVARPNALILYKTLALGPKLGFDEQLNSTRHFMRELNRLGLTSIIDAGGGFQNYPDDYKVIESLHKDDLLTLRLAYNLFTQNAGKEYEDFAAWMKMTEPYKGDSFYRMNGAGEMLVFSAADFEDFLEPRPDLPAPMEEHLKRVVRLLAQNRWPFRLHATYDESITRFLNVFEEVNRDVPLDNLRWFFDHAETISQRNIERVKALGGGIAIQHRMAYQGEYFVDRYGTDAAQQTPPINRMLRAGVPVGAGTDATRVASYNPWVALDWLVTGKTVGGTALYPESNRLDRMEALRLYTTGSSWFSGEEATKGAIAPGQFADLAVLSSDYFSVPDDQIKSIESVLTMVGGKIVYGKDQFAALAPRVPPPSPSWSPVLNYGGYGAPGYVRRRIGSAHASAGSCSLVATGSASAADRVWGPRGCDCFAF
ncbi:MAG: amidohydrolase [Phycisphaerales bacterium]|nr:amidohydrolase [Phycisphaerales bacterium]